LGEKTKSIKQRLDEHPIVYWGGVVLFAIGIVTGPVVFALNNVNDSKLADKDREITNLQSQIDNLHFVAGTEPSELDVSKILIDADDLQNVAVDLAPLADAHIYALKADEGAGWSYDLTDERQLLIDQIGPEAASQIGADQLSTLPVHRWRHGDPVRLCVGPDAAGQCLNPSTQIIVERLSGDSVSSIPDKQLADLLKDQLKNDPLGSLFSSRLSLVMSSGTGRLLSVDRSDDALYASLVLTYQDSSDPGQALTIDGRPADVYYLVNNIFVFDTGTHLVLVSTLAATDDLRQQEQVWMKKFIGDLRLVKD